MNHLKYFLVFPRVLEYSEINNELWKVFISPREKKVSVNLTLRSIAAGNETYTSKQSPGDRLPSGGLLENIFFSNLLHSSTIIFKWKYFLFEIVF